MLPYPAVYRPPLNDRYGWRSEEGCLPTIAIINICKYNVDDDSDNSNGALLVVDDDHDGYDILQSIIRELFCMNIQ